MVYQQDGFIVGTFVSLAFFMYRVVDRLFILLDSCRLSIPCYRLFFMIFHIVLDSFGFFGPVFPS